MGGMGGEPIGDLFRRMLPVNTADPPPAVSRTRPPGRLCQAVTAYGNFAKCLHETL